MSLFSEPLRDCENNAQWKHELPPIDKGSTSYENEIRTLKAKVEKLENALDEIETTCQPPLCDGDFHVQLATKLNRARCIARQARKE